MQALNLLHPNCVKCKSERVAMEKPFPDAYVSGSQ